MSQLPLLLKYKFLEPEILDSLTLCFRFSVRDEQQPSKALIRALRDYSNT